MYNVAYRNIEYLYLHICHLRDDAKHNKHSTDAQHRCHSTHTLAVLYCIGILGRLDAVVRDWTRALKG